MQYRIYFLGRGGRFDRAVDIECLDDAQAIREAVTKHDGAAMELWQGERLVRKFPQKLP